MHAFAVVKYSFIVIGFVLTSIAINSYINDRAFFKNSILTHGTVIDFKVRRDSDHNYIYSPVIQFTSNEGKELKMVSLGSSRRSLSKGERVEVAYLPNNPHEAKLNTIRNLWGGTIVFSLLGAPFALIGLLLMLIPSRKRKLASRLKLEGVPINARLAGVRLNSSLSINGRNPYQLIAQWLDPATNREHLFYSENLWFDPRGQLKGETLTVYIENGNPKKYYIDISFLIPPSR